MVLTDIQENKLIDSLLDFETLNQELVKFLTKLLMTYPNIAIHFKDKFYYLWFNPETCDEVYKIFAKMLLTEMPYTLKGGGRGYLLTPGY